MGIGVIAEGEAGTTPELEDFNVFGMLLEFLRVDKAVDFRDVRVFEGLEDTFGNVSACHARRQGAVGGQIVDRDSDLLGETGRGEHQQTDASAAKETG